MRLLPALVALLWSLAGPGSYPVEGRAMDKEAINPLQTLSDFKGYKYDYTLGPQGVYTFYYVLPQSSRFEERTASGEVKGNYAYVAPEGDEFKFKYEAGKKGFQVESNALPTAPEDTDEVKRAKEQFFEAYEKALTQAVLEEGYGQKKRGKGLVKGESKVVGEVESQKKEEGEEEEEEEEEEEKEEEEEEEEEKEEEEEESSEESSEEDDDDDDDDDEESSEEDDDEESSEEDDDESKEEEDEDSDEIQKNEDVRKALNVGRRLNLDRKKSSSYEIPNYIYKNRIDVPRQRRLARRNHNSNHGHNNQNDKNSRTRRKNVGPQAPQIRRNATERVSSGRPYY